MICLLPFHGLLTGSRPLGHPEGGSEPSCRPMDGQSPAITQNASERGEARLKAGVPLHVPLQVPNTLPGLFHPTLDWKVIELHGFRVPLVTGHELPGACLAMWLAELALSQSKDLDGFGDRWMGCQGN